MNKNYLIHCKIWLWEINLIRFFIITAINSNELILKNIFYGFCINLPLLFFVKHLITVDNLNECYSFDFMSKLTITKNLVMFEVGRILLKMLGETVLYIIMKKSPTTMINIYFHGVKSRRPFSHQITVLRSINLIPVIKADLFFFNRTL